MGYPCDKDNWIDSFKYNELWAGLNNMQRDAVALPNKHSLILAGAGTGKTKTLISRIAALLEDGGLEADEILAVTFTNKAALEMKERLESSIGKKSKGLLMGTFHGICYKWIKSDWHGFGYKMNAAILDTDDQKALMRRLYKDKKWDEGKISLKEAMEFINDKKEKGIRSNNVTPKHPNDHILVTIYSEYEKRLKEENALDFAELLMAVRDRLVFDEEYFKHMSGKWKILLVDEFQDTNPLQYSLLELLVKQSGAIFAVGDDDQSVYGFRGARVENVFDFEKNYAKNQVIKLEQNYRCSGNILGAANEIISKSKHRMGKKLWTDKKPGDLVYVLKTRNEEEEAEQVARSVKYAIEDGVLPKEIAVLYRTNAQSNHIEKCMINKQIPYKIVGGMRFFERAEIKLAMAHARMLASQDDFGAFCKAVVKPAQGIGQKRIEMWRNLAIQHKMGFYEMIEKVAKPDEKGRFDLVAKAWVDKMNEAKKNLLQHGLSKGFKMWMDSIQLFKVYEKDDNYKERVENLNEFVNTIALYEEKGGKFLEEFISTCVLDSSSSNNEEGGVQLSTIHASKGLEYERVYWIGLEDGLTPSSMSLKDDSSEAEERRLAYVAITRAKKELTLSFCQSRFINGERKELLPSRYLGDINPELFFPIGTEWPPSPLPTGWGIHQGKFTGKQIASFNIRKVSEASASRNTNENITEKNHSKVFNKKKVNTEFKTGDKVKSSRFGIGKITSVLMDGDLEVVMVKFADGNKKMIVKFAGLTKI